MIMIAKVRCLALGAMLAVVTGCAGTSAQQSGGQGTQSRDPDSLLIVDCLLPGQVRQLGSRLTYQSPRRPIKSSASVCELRGGEYAAYDRANFATALKIWLPKAKEGDPEAQTYVGEIYEKGLGVSSDYALAASWYQRAADNNHSRAMINLGYLYETGLGVGRDLTVAMNYYRDASGLTDGDLEYVSSIEYARREATVVETSNLRSQVAELQQTLATNEEQYRAGQQSLQQESEAISSLKLQIAEQQQLLLNEAAKTGAATDKADAESIKRQAETAVYIREVEALVKRVTSAENERRELASSLQQRQATTAELRREYTETNSELFAAQAQLQKQQGVIDQLEKRINIAGTDKSSHEQRLADSRAEVVALEATIARLRTNQSGKSAELETKVAAAEVREKELTAQLDGKSDALAALKTEQLGIEINYQRNIVKLRNEILDSRQEQQRLTSRLSTTSLETAEQKAANQQLREQLENQGRAVALREQEQQRLTEQLASARLSSRAGNNQRQQLQASLARTSTELSVARLEQSRLTNRLLGQQLSARRNERKSAFDLALLEGRLEEREERLALQQQKLERLENRVSNTRAQLNDRANEQVIQVVASGPLIDIIEPPVLVTRGTPTLPLKGDGTVDVIGKVDPAANLLAFNINGLDQTLNDAGVFRFQGRPAGNSLELVAIDNEGQDTRLKLLVDKPAGTLSSTGEAISTIQEPSLKGIEFGRYHALVIGNNNYKSLSDLNTAENDARAVDRLLREKYGFQTTLLVNATRVDLLSALNQLRETLTPQDNLLVYYAGHGELDEVNQRGYWLPVDANATDSANWVSNSAITSFLDTMAAKHILVIADSCYSGTLTRSSLARRQPDMTPEIRKRWLKAISGSKVRAVLSSGGVKPVYDGTVNAQHSLFADAFIDELTNNPSVLEGYSLFFSLQQRVSTAASRLGVEQSPQYSPIKHAGHEAGEFLFVPTALKSL